MSARARARATAVATVLVTLLAVWWYARPTPSQPTPLPPSPPVVVAPSPSPAPPAPRPPPSRSPEIHEIDLGWIEDPGERAEVARVATAIDRGGPFAYRKDGAVFENREGHLPARPPGYWREYTVPTPGSRDRGARRLVAGQRREIYYTRDHYRSFAAVRGATP